MGGKANRTAGGDTRTEAQRAANLIAETHVVSEKSLDEYARLITNGDATLISVPRKMRKLVAERMVQLRQMA